MKPRVFYFLDKAGKLGHFETARKGSNFDWRITPAEAARLFREHGDKLAFDVMCKEYGDDKDWVGMCAEDLRDADTASTPEEIGQFDSDYKTFEVFALNVKLETDKPAEATAPKVVDEDHCPKCGADISKICGDAEETNGDGEGVAEFVCPSCGFKASRVRRFVLSSFVGEDGGEFFPAERVKVLVIVSGGCVSGVRSNASKIMPEHTTIDPEVTILDMDNLASEKQVKAQVEAEKEYPDAIEEQYADTDEL